MASAETEFVNELGNDISIDIEDLDDSVKLTITGPTSASEWTVTPMEFAKMRMLMLMHASISDHNHLKKLLNLI